MARTVPTQLTEVQKQRLAQCPNEFKSPGDPNDNTRLINSWKGALDHEKKELFRIVKEDPGTTATKVKGNYPMFRVFETPMLGTEINNTRKRIRKEVDKEREMVEEQAQGGPVGGGGMTAKTSSKAKLPTVDETGNEDVATKGGKTAKSKKHSSDVTAAKSGMYDCDVTFCNKRCSSKGTIKTGKHGSSKSVVSLAHSVAACSINGKSFGGDGSVIHHPNEVIPCMAQRVDKAIGGSLCVSQVEIWRDGSGNCRGSLHLVTSPIAVLSPDNSINIRTSLRNKAEVIFQVILSTDFTHPDTVLNYVLKRIKKAFPHLKTKEQRRQFLRIHPRYTSMVENLKLLLGSKQNFVFEYRVLIGDPSNLRKPVMEVAESLVLSSEDALFFGIQKEVTDTGTHVHLEFKEKGKLFVPVNYQGLPFNPIGNSPPRPQHGAFMFGSPASEDFFASVPEEVQVNSPYPTSARAHVQEDDEIEEESSDDEDDSTISSKMSVDSSSSSSSSTSTEEPAGVAKKKDDIDIGACVDADGQFSQQKLMAMLLDQYYEQQKQKASHAKKKTRTPDGSFDEEDSCHKTAATRGTHEREEKRKKPKAPASQADEELDCATRKSTKSKRSSKTSKSKRSNKSSKSKYSL